MLQSENGENADFLITPTLLARVQKISFLKISRLEKPYKRIGEIVQWLLDQKIFALQKIHTRNQSESETAAYLFC